MADNKTVTFTLPSGSRVTASVELAKRMGHTGDSEKKSTTRSSSKKSD